MDCTLIVFSLHITKDVTLYLNMFFVFQVERLKISHQSSPTPPDDTSSNAAALAELQSRLEADHKQQIDSLQNKITNLEQQVTQANTDLAQSQAQYSEANSRLQKVQTDNTVKDVKISELESTISEKETESEDLLLLLETNSEKLAAQKARLKELGETVSESEEEEEEDD